LETMAINHYIDEFLLGKIVPKYIFEIWGLFPLLLQHIHHFLVHNKTFQDLSLENKYGLNYKN
jgi:hypothetical protein